MKRLRELRSIYICTGDEEVVYRFLCSFPLLKANVSFPRFDDDGFVTIEAAVIGDVAVARVNHERLLGI